MLGVGLSAYICTKLTLMFRLTTFINKLFTILFLCNTLTSFTICWFLFKIAELNFSDSASPSPAPPEELHYLCKVYIVAWISSQQFMIVGNVGIIFCRFIYTRYARALVSEGTATFHGLSAVLIMSFTAQFILMYPFSGLWRFYSTYPLNMIKGRLCALVPVHQGEWQDEKNGFAWKHKLIICTMMLLFILAVLYFNFSSQKKKRYHFIPKNPRNLMTLKQQTIYTVTLLFGIIFDQIVNHFVEVFYFHVLFFIFL